MQCPETGLPAHTKGDQPRECQICIDHINICRLMVEPRTDSVASNQTVAINYFMKLVPDMTLQEIFMFQKRFEALAAQASLIYSDQLRVERIPNPKELQEKSKKKQADWTQAVEEQKDKQRPPKEKKILSDRDKAIAAYVAVGVSEKESIEIVDKQMAAIGRVAK